MVLLFCWQFAMQQLPLQQQLGQPTTMTVPLLQSLAYRAPMLAQQPSTTVTLLLAQPPPAGLMAGPPEQLHLPPQMQLVPSQMQFVPTSTPPSFSSAATPPGPPHGNVPPWVKPTLAPPPMLGQQHMMGHMPQAGIQPSGQLMVPQAGPLPTQRWTVSAPQPPIMAQQAISSTGFVSGPANAPTFTSVPPPSMPPINQPPPVFVPGTNGPPPGPPPTVVSFGERAVFTQAPPPQFVPESSMLNVQRLSGPPNLPGQEAPGMSWAPEMPKVEMPALYGSIKKEEASVTSPYADFRQPGEFGPVKHEYNHGKVMLPERDEVYDPTSPTSDGKL